jgi:hypothetical protein
MRLIVVKGDWNYLTAERKRETSRTSEVRKGIETMIKTNEKLHNRVLVKTTVNMFGEREDRIWGGPVQNAEKRLLWR